MEDVRKHRHVKLVTTEKRQNYHITKFFMENLLEIEMKKTQILMHKPVYLGLSILDLSKTIIYEFWYDHLKLKYCVKVNLCYMDTDSFIVHVKTNNIYKDIAEDVEKRFGTSNFKRDRTLPKGKNKKNN